MNLTQVSPKGGRNTECRKLRVEYHPNSDCVCICHYSDSGILLSEACLSIEEGLDYAKTVNAVCDEALGLQ